MLNKIIETAVSTAAVVYNHSVAAAQTITDDEVKQAWKHRQQRIKAAKQQFSLTVKDVFREKLEARTMKAKKDSKAKARKRLAKSAA